MPGLIREQDFGGVRTRFIGHIHMQWHISNFLALAKTTAITYHQNIAAPGNFSPVCNSSCIRKRQEITSMLKEKKFREHFRENNWLILIFQAPEWLTSNIWMLPFLSRFFACQIALLFTDWYSSRPHRRM